MLRLKSQSLAVNHTFHYKMSQPVKYMVSNLTANTVGVVRVYLQSLQRLVFSYHNVSFYILLSISFITNVIFISFSGRVNTVGIATSYELEGLGIQSR
jgi:hypothetical protein